MASNRLVELTNNGPSRGKKVAPRLGCQGYPHKSRAGKVECREDCRTCVDQWFTSARIAAAPPLEHLTDADAGNVLTTFIKQTQDNLAYLRKRIHERGDELITRWEQLQDAERAAVLKKAMPDMYPRHGFPAAETTKWKNTTASQEQKKIRLRKPFLLPYLDVKTLSKDSALILSLMHHRSSTEPCDWLPFDSEQITTSFVSGYLQASYNPHCVIVHGAKYGELVSWEVDSAHQLVILSYPRASLAFEAQYEISRLLRSMFDLVMVPAPDSGLCGRQFWNVASPRGFSLQDDRAMRNAAFGSAPNLDLTRTQRAFSHKLQVVSGELQAMQMEPCILRERLHRLSLSRTLQTIAKEAQEDEFVKVAMLSLRRKEHMDHMSAEVKLAHHTTLPPWEFVLRMNLVEYLNYLRFFAMASPDFASHVTLISNDTLVWRWDADATFRSDPQYYHVTCLLNQGTKSSYLRSHHIQCLKRYLATASPKEVDRLDGTMWDVLSDISIIDEALTDIELHRPRSTPVTATFNDGQMSLPLEIWDKFIMDRYCFYSSIRSAHAYGFDGHPALRNTLLEFLRLPFPAEDLNKQSLEAFNQSHAALAKFWDQVRLWRFITLRAIVPKLELSFIKDCLSCLSMSRSEEYKLQCQAQRKNLSEVIEVIEKIKDERRTKAATRSVTPGAVNNPVQTVWDETPSPIEASAPKTKIKTRPEIPAGTLDAEEENEVEETPSEHGPWVQVRRKQSYDLLEQMYSSDPGYATRYTWLDFVAAMVDIGFSVSHGHGAAVSFASKDGTIVFHKPHPEPDLDTRKLRDWGKRLNGRFGWDQYAFELVD